jgi:O-antigen/teichoic acid export membrane protein
MKPYLLPSTPTLDQAHQPFKWSFLLEATNRVIPPLTYLILTQILVPEDFGVFATAIIIVNFLQLLTDFGLGKALVQTDQDLEKSANVVFWVSILLGIMTYGLLLALAPFAASFFNNPGLPPTLGILGVQILLNSLAVCPQTLLTREMGFRKLFWARLASNLVPAAISIPAALFGLGVLALVGGVLTGSLLNVVLLWPQVKWRPRFRFDALASRPLLKFGAWSLLEGLGTWFFYWGDNLVVGKVYGNVLLGSYQVAWSLVSFTFALLVGSFAPVLYPLFSRMRENRDLVKTTFDRANSAVIAISMPLGISFFLTGGLIQESLFHSGWAHIGLLIRAIGLMSGFSWLVGINYEVYRALGRPDINTKILFFSIGYYAPIYLLTSQISFEAFVIGRFAATLLAVAVHVIVFRRVLHFAPDYLWRQSKSPLLASGIMAASILGAIHVLQDLSNAAPVVALVIAILVGMVSYMFSLWSIDRPLSAQLLSFGKRFLPQKA